MPAVLVQQQEDICVLLEVEPCNDDECWEPSDAWISNFLSQWGISSHKAQGKAFVVSAVPPPEEVFGNVVGVFDGTMEPTTGDAPAAAEPAAEAPAEGSCGTRCSSGPRCRGPRGA